MSADRRGKVEVDIDPTKLVRQLTPAEKNQLIREWLRRVRNEHKLTAKTIGENAGLVESTITRFARGDRNLSLDALLRVEKSIGTLLEQAIAEEELRRREKVGGLRELATQPPGRRLSNILHDGTPYDPREYGYPSQAISVRDKLIAAQQKIIALQEQIAAYEKENSSAAS